MKDGATYPKYVWRSYDNFFDTANRGNRMNKLNPGPAHTTSIWMVARATTAAPGYFSRIKIGDNKHIDGGLVANNPSLAAFREIQDLHKEVPALFVSIGTGLREESTTMSLKRRVLGKLSSRMKVLDLTRHHLTQTEDENGTDGWREKCQDANVEHYRLNVTGDLYKLPLDHWKPSNTGEDTLKEIREKTIAYLRNEDVRRQINLIASEAVRIRRERAATERWEPFAIDSDYFCRRCEETVRYRTRRKLRAHLEHSSAHNGNGGLSAQEVQEALNRGRTYKRRTPHARGS